MVNGRPPAPDWPPRAVWQAMQLPAPASISPLDTSSGANEDGAGGAIGGMTGCHARASNATTATAPMPAIARSSRLDKHQVPQRYCPSPVFWGGVAVIPRRRGHEVVREASDPSVGVRRRH